MDFSLARTNMVKSQIIPNGVDHPALLEALLTIPREPFVISTHQEFAYSDYALPINQARRSLKPLQIARLLQALGSVSGHTLLVVGAGTGYEAALLARMGAQVSALESDEALLEQGKRLAFDGIHWHSGPLLQGLSAQAPFDGILLCGAVESIPDPLLAQLGEQGQLLAILGAPGEPVMRAVRVHGAKEQTMDTLFETSAFPLLPRDDGQGFQL
ncbi:MAG: protein-L-isoaspartate O-methyltransferase [Magnetococcus sp. XQGC-1]